MGNWKIDKALYLASWIRASMKGGTADASADNEKKL
jgi:hypothetical protein